MLNTFYNISTIPICIVLSIVPIIISGYGLIMLEKQRLKTHDNHYMKRLLCVVLLYLSGICFGSTYLISREAYQHGCNTIFTSTIAELQTGIKYTPVEDILPNNLNNTIIIYYRFGCHDCELIYEQLDSATKHRDDIYWVATRSKQGQNLLKSYPVSDVPAIVKIDKHGIATTYDVTTKTKINDVVSITLDTKTLATILN